MNLKFFKFLGESRSESFHHPVQEKLSLNGKKLAIHQPSHKMTKICVTYANYCNPAGSCFYYSLKGGVIKIWQSNIYVSRQNSFGNTQQFYYYSLRHFHLMVGDYFVNVSQNHDLKSCMNGLKRISVLQSKYDNMFVKTP